MLARIAAEDPIEVEAKIRELWLAAQTEPVRLGLPVAECDPLNLEVHPAIDVPGHRGSAGPLPVYVVRSHDALLRQAADRVMVGTSMLVTVVGGSSTGKTRACWELAQYLEDRQPGRWWLWHPYDPTRPDAVLSDLNRVGPYTVVWLNEAQYYLSPPDAQVGECIAAGLRTLLQNPQRGPVLVLATLWREHWSALTIRPGPDEPDPYPQAREILEDTRISVADEFSAAELVELNGAEDARLREAAAHAEDGRITQYLAGVPALENRYRTALPGVRAIIEVAMDARRLGHPLAIPYALLEQAAAGYLDDHDWDALDEDWLEQALAYTGKSCRGARGPLTRIRTRPGDPPSPYGQQCYRLADYLEQIGRSERGGVYPPESLWTAFTTTVTDPDLLLQLGHQAEIRSRYQHAITLYSQAANLGNTRALRSVVLRRNAAGDHTGAEALAVEAADRGNLDALYELAQLRDRAGEHTRAEVLYRQAADRGDVFALQELVLRRDNAADQASAEALAQAADRGYTFAWQELVRRREATGDHAGAEALVPAGRRPRRPQRALQELARRRDKAGDHTRAEVLYRQAADRGYTFALRELVRRREAAGDYAGAEALAMKVADRGDPGSLQALVRAREAAGDHARAEALAIKAADHGNTRALQDLARARDTAGDRAGAEALYLQAANRGDTFALRGLIRWREAAGDRAGAEALYLQAADCGNPFALRELVRVREAAGDHAGAEALAVKAADRGDPFALRELVRVREAAGDHAGADALAVKDYAALRELVRAREAAGDHTSAEALYLQAANRGDSNALQELAWRLERAGDRTGADRMRRFGLTGAGAIETRLDYGE